MKTLRTVVIAVACVLLVGVAVEAAELFSPPVLSAMNNSLPVN